MNIHLYDLGNVTKEILKVPAKAVITGCSTVTGGINTAICWKGCKKCDCKKYVYNPVSEVEKTWLDNQNEAHKNCICGHNKSEHS